MAELDGKFIKNGTIVKSKLNLVAPTSAQDPVTLDFELKNSVQYATLTDFRLRNKSTLSDKAIVGDFIYKYDASDTTSPDNGNTIIVTLDGKRFVKIYSDLSPSSKTLISSKAAYGTVTQLRNLSDLETTYFNITNNGIEGAFIYDSTDTSTTDDGAMTIVNSGRRFKRVYEGILKPEWFGAKGDGTTDDGPAFQAMLNYPYTVAVKIVLEAKTYIINQSLIPRVLVGAPFFTYAITIEGAGDWITTLQCNSSTDIDSIISFTQGQTDFNGRNTKITIKNMRFDANAKASKCLHFRYIAGLDVSNLAVGGGFDANIVIDGESDNYGISFRNIYGAGGGKNNGHSVNNFYLRRVRYGLFDRITTDGSKYGLNFDGCDKNFITNCHIEGSKTAAIRLNGGENKIINNFILPYVSFEGNALFRGEHYGIWVLAPGGSSSNIISNNVTACYKQDSIALTISGYNSHLHSSPHAPNLITSNTGATGYLDGFNATNGDAVIRVVSGTFAPGQTITQFNSQTGGTGVGTLGAFLPNRTIGIYLSSEAGYAGSNIVSNNNIRGTQNYGIWNSSDYNNISTNNIEAHGSCYYNTSDHAVSNRSQYYNPISGGKAIENISTYNLRSSFDEVIAGTNSGLIKYELTSNSTSGYIPLTNSTGNLSNSVIRQNSNGFIGIGGAATDQIPVHIQSVWGTPLKLERTAPFSVMQSFKRPDKEYLIGINAYNNGTKEFSIYDLTTNVFRVIVFDNGNVKIGHGLTDTGHKLQVDGTIKGTKLNLNDLSVYADNAAAVTGGLLVGDLYRTSTGDVKIRY